VVLESIADISARLVINRVSLKMKAQRINPLIAAIRAQLAVRALAVQMTADQMKGERNA